MDSLFLKTWCLLVVMVAVLASNEEVAAPAGTPEAEAKVLSPVEEDKSAAKANVPPGFAAEIEAKENLEKEDDDRSNDAEDDLAAKKFFAYGSTTTAFGVSQITRTVPHTCFTAVNPVACVGRRKKSSSLFRFVSNYDPSNLDSGLQSSGASSFANPLHEVEDGKDAKFFFTVWSTSTSLLTITTFSTDTGATISVSAGCSIANYVYNGC